jgi:uncharacterized iron-regulated membrane protein
VRKTILKVHLYVALATCVFLLVIGFTGCLLVFELSVDRWWDSDLAFVEPRGEPVSFDTVLASLSKAFPGQKLTEMDLGDAGTSIIAKMGGRVRVFVNPYTGAVLGSRPGESLSFHLRHAHRELLAGKPGALLVNFVSLLLVLQSLSGIYLWWPLKRVTVKVGGSWKRFNFDLHHAAGFFSSAFICIVAVTGIVKAYAIDLQPFFDRITNSPVMTRTLPSRPAAGSTSHVALDTIVAAARGKLPGAAIARIQPPLGKDGSWTVSMKYPEDSTIPGRSWVVVNQYTGEILGFQSSRTAPLGTQITIQNRAIHVGGIYGLPTRILAFLTAFSVLVQTVTGLLMWWRKRKTVGWRASLQNRSPAVRPNAAAGSAGDSVPASVAVPPG